MDQLGYESETIEKWGSISKVNCGRLPQRM
jgi:hypothetical protein